MTIEAITNLKRLYWRYLEQYKSSRKNHLDWLHHTPKRLEQVKALRTKFPQPKQAEKLIIFLSPGEDTVNGGIMSIVSLYEETLNLKTIHGAECLLCTLPMANNAAPLLRYSKFHNNAEIFDFHDALKYFDNTKKILIHIPEFAIKLYVNNLTPKEIRKFKKRQICHNVMLQNIDLVKFEHFGLLRKLGKTTCTTAHKAYSNQDTADLTLCPIQLLSVFISPEKYQRIDYSKKRDILIVSPDQHPLREVILEQIHNELPELDIRVVQDIPYLEYKRLIAQAKWALTFGEGLDGYFIETVFSGGLSFAVYNERFFTSDFRNLETVFSSYDNFAENLISTIRRLDTPPEFQVYQQEIFELCCSHYAHERYIDNLVNYYQHSFLSIPTIN